MRGRRVAHQRTDLCRRCQRRTLRRRLAALWDNGLGRRAPAGTAFSVTPQGSMWSEETFYSFCSMRGCADGNFPSATLLADGTGALYGTTKSGGANNSGTVFRLSASSRKAGWTETV